MYCWMEERFLGKWRPYSNILLMMPWILPVILEIDLLGVSRRLVIATHHQHMRVVCPVVVCSTGEKNGREKKPPVNSVCVNVFMSIWCLFDEKPTINWPLKCDFPYDMRAKIFPDPTKWPQKSIVWKAFTRTIQVQWWDDDGGGSNSISKTDRQDKSKHTNCSEERCWV